VANGPDLGQGIAEAFSHPLQIVNEDFGHPRASTMYSQTKIRWPLFTTPWMTARRTLQAANPLSSALVSLREQVVSLSETHLVSSAVVNQATLGFSARGLLFHGDTSVSLPGFVQGRPIGAVVVGGGTTLNGASQISAAGTNAGSNPRGGAQICSLGQDRVTATHGIHTVEFGAWVQRLQAQRLPGTKSSMGKRHFRMCRVSFLDGTVSTFTVARWQPPRLAGALLKAPWFAQDALKLTPNFELRIGFRSEFTNGWKESHGRASNYVFDASGVIATNPVVGNSALTVNNAKFLPAPRLAMAWSPFSSKTTVIRAGFGLYYALNDNLSYSPRPERSSSTPSWPSKTYALSSINNCSRSAPSPAGAKISPSGVQPDLKTPTVESYSLKIEQQVTTEHLVRRRLRGIARLSRVAVD